MTQFFENKLARIYPEGIPAISRWSRSAPPVRIGISHVRSQRERSALALASLRDANVVVHRDPVVALRLPPANLLNPFGVNTDTP